MTMLDPALALAARGIPVFPCDWRAGDHEKAPLLPSPGYHLATTDAEQIQRWWRRWPLALLGAPVPEHLAVVDIDPRRNGSLEVLEHLAGCRLPETLICWSGRNDGGHHRYYLRPVGELTGARLKPLGIDLKVSGYCIVAPSLHPSSGKPYRWEHHPIADMPAPLIALLQMPSRAFPSRSISSNGSGDGLVRKVATAIQGSRNDTLFWAACRACEDGLIDAIEADLIEAATATGLTEPAARATITSARGRYV